MDYDADQLHALYEEMVRDLRRSGVVCGITSGLACVHFDVAETTKDCDLLCSPESFHLLLDDLKRRQINGQGCAYRGNMTAPLDKRWHLGGWTSHFCWGRGPDATMLDVFGRALRGSSDWEGELAGLYVSPHVVSEMKRTNRDKDWPFVTALGVRMLNTGDSRGWLHLYDEATLEKLISIHRCPDEFYARRPVLALARDKDKRTAGVLHVERLMWEKIDELRMHIYQRAVRPYLVEVRKSRVPENASLSEQHAVRVACAERRLPESPLCDHGVQRLLNEAKQTLLDKFAVAEEMFAWLPDFTPHFNYSSS